MSKTCYNCATENAESERFCHRCGASLVSQSTLQQSGIQGGRGEERVLWDNGHLQLTTDAVLIGVNTDAPDVVPLETIYDMDVQEGCLVLRVKDGDDRQCMLDSPENLADLIWDHVFRPRLAQNRGEKGYIPPD